MPETYAFERSKDMRKKKVTSSDIAHAAGVSQATVSMILNKKYNVSFSKETIRKVEQIAEEMGYEVPKRKTRRESRTSRTLIMLCCFKGLNPVQRSRDMDCLCAIPRGI